LNANNIEGYECWGELGIDNLTETLKILERIDNSHIEIFKESNFLKFKGGNKTIEILLRDIEYLEKPPVYPVLSHDITISLNMLSIKSFLDDVSALNATEINFLNKDGKLLLIVKGQHVIKSVIDIEVPQDLCINFSPLLTDAIMNLDGDINIGLKNNYPILFTSNVDNGKGFVKVLIAPKV